MAVWMLLSVILPIAGGVMVAALPEVRKIKKVWTGAFLCAGAACMLWTAWKGAGVEITLWRMTDTISIALSVDGLSRFFLALVAVMWTLTGFYAFGYMEHEESRFYGFYLISMGVLSGLCMAKNLVTFYLFYEAMTLMTVPLVMHDRTKEAIAAGIKYLVYSVFGASAALFGIFYLNGVCDTLNFVPGGSLSGEAGGALLWVVMIMILGFGTKAGMFPLHAWLPTAHPVAPAPASAVLSGVITKMGVLGVTRVVFYCVGADNIRGTWVQTAWMVLALITVFMGSMLALGEDVFKKRLAYSSVSQVSYILFALSTLTATGFEGAMLHVVFHSAIKITLFMTAGVVIHTLGITKVSEMEGIGKRIPLVMGLYTIVSLGLIGIPPTGGFVSKWYMATGAMEMGTAGSFIGPAVLLLSAILTAAYLLPVAIRAFFNRNEQRGHEDLSATIEVADEGKACGERVRVSAWMWVPMAALTAFVLFGGMFPQKIFAFVSAIAAAL